jgi:hypothetical protein
MARARIIKPGFFKNENLVECSFGARLLFAGLWTLADRAGRLEDRPKKIKMEIFPCDDVDCDSLLKELCAHKFIKRYQVDGNKYIQIIAFCAHQKPHKNEVESVIPSPDKAQPIPEQDVPKSDQSGLNLNPDYLNLNPETPIPPEGDFEIPNPFAVWYENYPHKIGRAAAEKAFWKAMHKGTLEELERGLERYIRTKPPDRPWCNPATWLNQERWKDEPNEITKTNNGKPTKSDRAEAARQRALERLGAGEIQTDQPDGEPVLRQLEHIREGTGAT